MASAIHDAYEKNKRSNLSSLIFEDTTHNNMPLLNSHKPTDNKDNIHSDDPEDENRKRKTSRSATSRSNASEVKKTVYEIYYGDFVYITKADESVQDIEDRLFMGWEMNQMRGCEKIKSSSLNLKKYLFKLVHPNSKF